MGVPPDQEHWVYRLPQGANVMAHPIIEHMKKHGVKTVGFLGYNDGYGELWLKQMGKDLGPAGITLVTRDMLQKAGVGQS